MEFAPNPVLTMMNIPLSNLHQAGRISSLQHGSKIIRRNRRAEQISLNHIATVLSQELFLLLCLVLLPFILIIPLLGWIIGGVWAIALLILWIMGIISAATGREKSLPLIGKLTDKLVI